MDINKYIEGKIKDKESYKTFMNPALHDVSYVDTRMSNVIKEALTSNDMFSMLNLDLDETIKKAMEYFEEKYKESSTTPEALFKIAIKDFLLSNISEDKIEATKNASIFKTYLEKSFDKVKEYKEGLEYKEKGSTYRFGYVEKSTFNFGPKHDSGEESISINLSNNTGNVNSMHGNHVKGSINMTNVQQSTSSRWY